MTEQEKAELDAKVAAAELAHTRAETRKIAAETRAQEAQAALTELERQFTEHRVRQAKCEALRSEMTCREYELEHHRALAQDSFHGIYQMNGVIDGITANECIRALTLMTRTGSHEVEVVINSPGGSVPDGMGLFDYIQELRRTGVRVITSARGMAASMGGILLQAGDERVMGAESIVLIHQPATGIFGKTGEIEDEIEYMHMIQTRVLSIFAKRSRQAFENGTAEGYLTREQFEHGDRELGIPGWNRKDWWLTSDMCLKYGIVDRVR